MLLARTCPICGATGAAPCRACARMLAPARPLPAPPGVDALCALLDYDGGGRELVARLKYRNARGSIGWLADRMARQVGAAGLRAELVTWLPTTTARRLERGFDQAELLARALAARLHLPARALLVRGPGPPQTGRSAAQRRVGPDLHVRRRARVPGAVLVVDDVVTTGVSVAVAARALRAAGATWVGVAAAARTPAPTPLGPGNRA